MTMPDWVKVLLDSLRAAPELVALGAQIGTVLPAGMPRNCVRVVRVGGAADDEVGHLLPTVQLSCYGAGEEVSTKQRTAQNVFNAAHAWLMDPSRARGRLIQGSGVNVLVVGCLTANLEQIESDTEYVAVVGRYRLRVFGAAS